MYGLGGLDAYTTKALMFACLLFYFTLGFAVRLEYLAVWNQDRNTAIGLESVLMSREPSLITTLDMAAIVELSEAVYPFEVIIADFAEAASCLSTFARKASRGCLLPRTRAIEQVSPQKF